MTAPVVLVHGAAVTSRIWDRVTGRLATERVLTPQRDYTGDLDAELAQLSDLVTGAVVVGVSGGATLGLELAARGAAFTAAVLHEPAVGSLLPGLLAPMAAAYADGGVAAFGRTLYGPTWSPADAPADPEAVARDLAMFRAFEPRRAADGAGEVLITVGETSPPARHEAARLLADRLGYRTAVLPCSGHAAFREAPGELAGVVNRFLTSAPGL